jgi:prepilin-type N-terminal cleavage/methylation domain-containing protein
MRMNTRGFSLIETMITLVIAGTLLNVGVKAAAPVTDDLSVKSARGAVMALHARARAHAVERGTMVRLVIDPATDVVSLVDGTDVIETVDLHDTRGIDLTASAPITLCMTPRGFADSDCNSFSSAVTFGLERGGVISRIKLRPLGQLVII